MKRRTTIMALVALALVMLAASATDWQQFQKDEINTGWTTDYAPISDPTLVWSKQTTGTGMGGIDVAPIVGDRQVFVLDYVGNVWAFNATTGQLNWNRSCTAPGTFELSTPAYNDGILYVATSSGDLNQGYCRVTALYANNGTKRENITLKTTDGYQLYTPVTYADDRIYLGDWNGSATTTNGSGTYYCLNASNVSDILWNCTPNRVSCGYRWAGAAIIGDYILFGDTAANVTCLYNDNATFVDYINISEVCGCSDPVEEIRSSIAWNESTGHIYFTAGKQDTAHSGYGTGHVYAVAFNATTGDLGDTCTWSNDIWHTTSTPVYYDDRIYVGGGAGMGLANGPGRMRCLNATNGSTIWEKWDANAGRVQASPALSVVGGRKFIYYTTNVNNGSAYCLEDVGDNYTVRWVWNPPDPDNQYILQGVAISDGFVYFGTDYGRIYALGGMLRIKTTHHYGNTSPYNGTFMFNMELVCNGSTPLQMLRSVADVTMNGSRVCGINGLNESPPCYWYLYINGIPAPDADIDSYQLREGEVVHWDYSSMINAGGGKSGSKSYSAMNYPEPPRSEIAKLIPEGSTPLDVLQSVADVTMHEGRVYSINGLAESPPYYWRLYINGMPVPYEDIDSYQLQDDETIEWRHSIRNNAGGVTSENR
ncbi:MAG: hypothetical protein C4B59_09470 [Candidatus Methanogaster sp.]|uniref:Uncharacterized protein n=1 Tax=Candidatus Methanogaster sp. TaxID=3386292 RepID=A0AC61L1B9_9EURY|nr:MAG: hypothetical protein C4B59_09470 [ANME-2 cluster archaeon]